MSIVSSVLLRLRCSLAGVDAADAAAAATAAGLCDGFAASSASILSRVEVDDPALSTSPPRFCWGRTDADADGTWTRTGAVGSGSTGSVAMLKWRGNTTVGAAGGADLDGVGCFSCAPLLSCGSERKAAGSRQDRVVWMGAEGCTRARVWCVQAE